MKAANCTSNKRAVNALLVHTETQAALMQIAADTMSLYVCQLGRLATSYPALSELDLSNSLAVLSVEDYAEIQQTSLYGHPQARAILAQQAVPIDVQRFLEMVLPHSQEFVLPCLTLLRIKLAKVGLLPQHIAVLCWIATDVWQHQVKPSRHTCMLYSMQRNSSRVCTAKEQQFPIH